MSEQNMRGRDLGDRLKSIRGELGLTAAEMAAHAGISRGFYSQVENGHRPLSDKSAAALRRSLGVVSDFLKTGEGPRFAAADTSNSEQVDVGRSTVFFAERSKQVDSQLLREASPHYVADLAVESKPFMSALLSHVRVSQNNATPWRVKRSDEVNLDPPQAEGRFDPRDTVGALLPVTDIGDVRPLVLSLVLNAGEQLDYEVIPKICGGASAGVIPREGAKDSKLVMDQAGEWAFSFDWMRRNLSHTSGDVASVHVIGDSMSPTLFDGDTVLIDRGFNEVTVDAVYVIDMLGQRLVKRVQRKSDGALVIISDNKAYARETIPRNRVREIQVIGRVVWPRVR